ncbi:CMP/dCMP-type deaminase domain-containing protein [Favolaschia claudopus]|uniref:CMP/dCMP-type deaminase domain-containing protein n=1 Tax=Favolaschia claudopus TaxID=2862362 RepID=A0AAW0DUN2_9AGAR
MSMKSQFYLSLCADAASKSTMYYQLGSVIVKGGKVISTGFNHQRPNYCEPRNGRPMSMHAEMASIFNATRGAAPALKQQQQQQQQRKEQQQNEKKKKAKRYAEEEYSRDLERLSPGASLVPYEAKTTRRRVSYQTGRPAHYQGQEADDACEGKGGECSVGQEVTGKQQRRSQQQHSKLNGCDLYVCRTTKKGEFGCSKPCWRCVSWCRWAGIKRIFHWSVEEGRFICLKVGDASVAECYETVADVRLVRSRAVLV